MSAATGIAKPRAMRGKIGTVENEFGLVIGTGPSGKRLKNQQIHRAKPH